MEPLNGLAVPLSDVRRGGLTLTSDGTSLQKHDVEIKEIPRIGLVQCPLSHIKNKVGSSKPTYGRGEMTKFEKIFSIPSSHVLETKFHSYGSGLPDRWIHVEYDDRGQFIARY